MLFLFNSVAHIHLLAPNSHIQGVTLTDIVPVGLVLSYLTVRIRSAEILPSWSLILILIVCSPSSRSPVPRSPFHILVTVSFQGSSPEVAFEARSYVAPELPSQTLPDVSFMAAVPNYPNYHYQGDAVDKKDIL